MDFPEELECQDSKSSDLNYIHFQEKGINLQFSGCGER